MQLEEEIVRFEVCEKCHEHEKSSSHAEVAFFNAFNECKKKLNDHGFKVIHNIPHKYLKKIANSKTSTKRYLDQNTNKIHQFPRKGAFQVHYINILVFSKLQSGIFPEPNLLLSIIKGIKNSYENRPLLESFSFFRDIEMERKKNQKVLDSIYEFIKLTCPDYPTQKDIETIFNKLEKNKIVEKQAKIIYPYSFYAQRQKQGRMQKIYCPSLIKKPQISKGFKNLTSKVSSYFRPRPPTSPSKLPTFTSNQIFKMVRGGGEKTFDFQKIKNLPKSEFKQTKTNCKNLYIAYLNKTVRGKTQIKGQQTNRNSSNIYKINNQSTERAPKKSVEIRKDSLFPPNQTQRVLNKVSQRNSSFQKDDQLRFQSIKEEHNEKVENVQPESKKNTPNNSQRGSIIDNVNLSSDRKPDKEQKQQQKQEEEEVEIRKSPQKQKQTKKEERQSKPQVKERSKEQQFEELWQINKLQAQIPYESASIIKKFSQKQNFMVDLFKNQYEKQKSRHASFMMKGEQLSYNFCIQRLRAHFRPNEMIMFPESFSYVRGYSFKLMYVVNFLLKLNPIIISRLFENKKFINPFGIYCIWLKGMDGLFAPIIINDEFAFNTDGDFIYSSIGVDHSIWFILLEKAIAKLLGGYHRIEQVTIGDLFNMILGCPKVEFKNLNPERVAKIMNESIFYNQHAYLLTLSNDAIHGKSNHTNEIMRIAEFSKNINFIRDSAISLLKSETKTIVSLREFLFQYSFMSLIFFNSNFCFNQIILPNANTLKLITCQLRSKTVKNECYLLFNNFPAEKLTKVTIFKKLTDQEAHITEGMNPLEEEEKKYQYIGQITKKENFFFETSLDVGEYICLLETKFEDNDNMSMYIYSEKQIYIQEIKVHTNSLKNKKMSNSYYLKKSQRGTRTSQKKDTPPKVLLEKSLNKCSTASGFRSVQKKNQDFRIKRKFLVSDESDEGMGNREPAYY